VVEILHVVMAEDARRSCTGVVSMDSFRGGKNVVAQLDKLNVTLFHAIESLAVGFPRDGSHRGVVPFVFTLDVVPEGRFGCSIPDCSRIVRIDGGAANVKLG
jgi:hypothetical protein